MTDDPVAAFFARAGKILEGVPEPDWDRIVDAVIDAVRRAPRGGWPLDVDMSDHDHDHDHADDDRSTDDHGKKDSVASVVDGAIAVSDLVLRGALARALGDDSSVPRNIELTLDGRHLERIRVELAARYGAELSDVADKVRHVVAGVVEDILGRSHASVDDVDVVITDVVEGDPRAD
ncbi:hypothetical protein [Rhodococcoides trifolii]|nr:hypothetical protein [Rhodococcus trifolii]